MSSSPIALSASRRRTVRTRFAALHVGMPAAAAVWLIARFGLGLQVRTPGFAPGQHPMNLTVVIVLAASATAGAAAWAAVTLIERTASRPRRVWVVLGLAVLAASLVAPLAGHGITTASRLTLVCMHLAVAAALIPAFAFTIAPRRSADQAPIAPNRAPVISGYQRAS